MTALATGQHSCRRSGRTYARANDVAVIVEPASNNARKLFAGVDIAAPVSVIWDSLTDYDGLGTFIPGIFPLQIYLLNLDEASYLNELRRPGQVRQRCSVFCKTDKTPDPGFAGLAENRCLQRTQQGAKLLQIGEQEVAFGAKFRAKVVLNIEVSAA